MIAPVEHSGHLNYSRRALAQDAQEAMRGDIVRGIVELLTNADDAYVRQSVGGSGKVYLEVNHAGRGKGWTLSVADRATGMSALELEARLTTLGSRSSGFEHGVGVRGNRGRGAKDLVAFGRVFFETIRDDDYSSLAIDTDGEWVLEGPIRPTPSVRSRLGLGRGNGTVVTVSVAPPSRRPHFEKLSQSISTHYTLQDLLSDPSREVVLHDAVSGDKTHITAAYGLSSLEALYEGELSIEGFPDVTVGLVVKRLEEAVEKPHSDPYRACGLLIRGRRAIYDNTLCALEGNPYAARFAGYVTCPHIDALANEYDDRFEKGLQPLPTNPIPIITRRRDGLAPEHPFAKALWRQISSVLRQLADSEEERDRSAKESVANTETRRSLDQAASVAAKFLRAAISEIDPDEIAADSLGTETGGLQQLALVPAFTKVAPGESRSLGLLAHPKGLGSEEVVVLRLDPPGVLDLPGGVVVQLRKDSEDAPLVGRFEVVGSADGDTLLTATLGSREALAYVRVEGVAEVAPPPDSLVFEHDTYNVRPRGRRRLRILALCALRGF